MTTDRDINNIVASAKKDERIEEKRAIAQRMKADGLPIDMIAKYTQLSPDQIEKL